MGRIGVNDETNQKPGKREDGIEKNLLT